MNARDFLHAPMPLMDADPEWVGVGGIPAIARADNLYMQRTTPDVRYAVDVAADPPVNEGTAVAWDGRVTAVSDGPAGLGVLQVLDAIEGDT